MEMILNFNFMVFQANPRKGVVYYWLDGNSNRHRIKIEQLWDIAFHKQQTVVGDIQTATTDYSFHLWNYVDAKVVHLLPIGYNLEYPDPVMSVVTGKPTNKFDKSMTLEDRFLHMGFTPPSEESIKGLKTAIVRDDKPTGMLQKVFQRFRR